jgi:response regulator RpfG family c-di-GMP phosphodiesterase
MVTAMQDSHDVVAGLEAGADDYVTKPLSAKVLVARLRALLRRAGSRDGTEPRAIVDDDLEIQVRAADLMQSRSVAMMTEQPEPNSSPFAFGSAARESVKQRVEAPFEATAGCSEPTWQPG